MENGDSKRVWLQRRLADWMDARAYHVRQLERMNACIAELQAEIKAIDDSESGRDPNGATAHGRAFERERERLRQAKAGEVVGTATMQAVESRALAVAMTALSSFDRAPHETAAAAERLARDLLRL